MDAIAGELVETGFVEGFELCHYRAQRGMRVDGYWFDDEGTLIVRLEDEKGGLLATSTVIATINSATFTFVPFKGSIEFSVTTTTRAFLIIPQRQNREEVGILSVRVPLVLLKK